MPMLCGFSICALQATLALKFLSKLRQFFHQVFQRIKFWPDFSNFFIKLCFSNAHQLVETLYLSKKCFLWLKQTTDNKQLQTGIFIYLLSKCSIHRTRMSLSFVEGLGAEPKNSSGIQLRSIKNLKLVGS